MRRSDNTDLYLSYIEAYKLVPWIYGSRPGQAKDYIGFDCADLVQAAAYHYKGDPEPYENSAWNLQDKRDAVGEADEPYYLVGGVLKKSDGVTNASFTIVNDNPAANQIAKGDLILLDKDGNGPADHATVLYSGSGILDGADTLIHATHDGVQTETLSSEISSSYKIYLRRGW